MFIQNMENKIIKKIDHIEKQLEKYFIRRTHFFRPILCIDGFFVKR